MKRKIPLQILLILLLPFVTFAAILLVSGIHNFAVLNPKGSVASGQRDLIVFTLLLFAAAVIPIFILTFALVWKFAEKRQAKYDSNWHYGELTTLLLWLVPSTAIFVLAAVTWVGTHRLDPYKQIRSNSNPITIQVITLRWKWLFIYPKENIAAVNFVEFPVGTPVNFHLTSDDAPMNSFWIPQLAGQIYAMTGMGTQLHLIADKPGEFSGSAAEINGKGFAQMKFIAKATSQTEFDKWISGAKASANILSPTAYGNLAKPSENNPVSLYSRVEPGLWNSVVFKYMQPTIPSMPSTAMGNMEMK